MSFLPATPLFEKYKNVKCDSTLLLQMFLLLFTVNFNTIKPHNPVVIECKVIFGIFANQSFVFAKAMGSGFFSSVRLTTVTGGSHNF